MLELPACFGERYRVMDRLGHGAIAEVVRAYDQRAGREVALKVLYPVLRESPIVVERFRREVELGRRIEDRHVLRIHQVDDSDGFLYLVMDFHPGGDLADRLARRGRLTPSALGVLARQLCAALGAAHRAGVIHRDLKPSNILVGPASGLDVRLCDFGLARSAEGSGLTTSAAVLGTPEYMAPEVIAEGHADPRSDLYSLGVVLFEAATGRLPLSADSPYQLMRLHLESSPPRARTLVPELPPAIDEAIARLLSKDPLDRFSGAEALAHALGDGTAMALRPSVPLPSRGRACRRCGGWLVETAGICADCGSESLRLGRQARGLSVLVTGPGGIGDRLDARKHVALFRLLEELPPSWAPRGKGARRAPRFPFYLARHLTAAAADRLLARVSELGLQGRVERGWAFAPVEMRGKARQLASRSIAVCSVGWLCQLGNFLPHELLRHVSSHVLALVPSLVFGTVFALSARRASRPVIPAPPPAAATAPQARLSASLAGLASRQDRRLLARIGERLAQLEGTALDFPLGLCASRAADLAGALLALERGAQASSALPFDASEAQAEIRRVERGRVLLRAEMLRLSSLLESAVAAGLRQNVARAAAELASEAAVVDELALAAEAERELAAFLAHRPTGAA
jgi:hypothetical protein